MAEIEADIKSTFVTDKVATAVTAIDTGNWDIAKVVLDKEDNSIVSSSSRDNTMSTDNIVVEKETVDAPHTPQLEIEEPTKVLDSTNTDTQKDHNEEGNSEDEYTDDDDSEYTYETISDDEANEPKKKKGWFGFLKRGKQTKQDDEGSISSSSSENEEEDIIAALDNHKQILSEEDESNSTVSSDDGHGKHHLLNSPQTIHPTISSSTSLNNNTDNKIKQEEKDEEEERLMAQAVQRVQQRIQQSGGNLYNALDEHDKQLVDELKGVKDVKKIKEVVDKSIDAEFNNKGGKDREEEAYMSTQTESPVIDIEPSAVENNKEGPNNQQQEQSLLDNESSEEEYDEESEDDEPTIVEKQSLLSLAAEHDRVDVINELLTVSEPSLNQFEHDLLLQGVSSVTSPNTMFLEGGRLEAIFIPPPLHVAVAHGSSNAASCLLRMRECDPSIRPQVPKQYLLGGYYDDGRSPSKGSSMNMKEDRNYKKYQDMSAWELAFGGTAVTMIVGDPTQVEEADLKEAAVEEPKRGSWFGFGSSSKIEEEPIKIENVIINGVSKQIKRKVPLNIPPSKLDGIKHAFTAEALRAIGSDEVDRVKQLIDAGMDGSLDVGGKTLMQWAVELDAKECCELFKASMEEEVGNNTKEEGREEVSADNQVAIDNNQAGTPSSPDKHQQSLPTHDERLAGLSLSDIQTLTTENLNLIPALTTCRNDLSSEAQICQSILRDVASTGGKGGLESQSLLQLVRTLKEQRAEAEEAANAWQKAWEEREDELDFFVEEILDDVHRNELLPILEQVEPIDPSMQGLTLVGSTANNMEEAVKRFIEVDNHVNVLRTQINNLADDKYMPEIERHGLMGALTLTRSLRDEVKEVEKKINLAMMGEGMCRRKIEIIQQRLGGGEDVTSGSASPEYEAHNRMNGDNRTEEEDYHLQAIAQAVASPSVTQVSETMSPSSPEEEEGHDDDQYVHVSPPEDGGSSDEYSEELSAASEDEKSSNEEEIGASANASNDILEEEEDVKEEEVATQELRSPSTVPDQQANQDIESPDADVVSTSTSVDRIPPKSTTVDNNSVDKPSIVIAQGKSTAIVLHSPNIQTGSIPSLVWEILKRIIGLSRAPSSRSQSYNDVETNPHVMTV